jgi:hypothetical protein
MLNIFKRLSLLIVDFASVVLNYQDAHRKPVPQRTVFISVVTHTGTLHEAFGIPFVHEA